MQIKPDTYKEQTTVVCVILTQQICPKNLECIKQDQVSLQVWKDLLKINPSCVLRVSDGTEIRPQFS